MSTGSVVSVAQHLLVNGVGIAYQDAGQGEPLVLGHGCWSSRRNSDPVDPGLCEHERGVIATLESREVPFGGRRIGRSSLLPKWRANLGDACGPGGEREQARHHTGDGPVDGRRVQDRGRPAARTETGTPLVMTS